MEKEEIFIQTFNVPGRIFSQNLKDKVSLGAPNSLWDRTLDCKYADLLTTRETFCLFPFSEMNVSFG